MFGSQHPDRRVLVPVWNWIKLSAGKSFECWIAGPGVGVHVHFNNGSKACRSVISDGQLACHFCEEGLKPTYRCYFPLWDRNRGRRAIALNMDYDRQALALPLHSAVVVKKLNIWGSPLCIEEDTRRDPFSPRNPEEQRPAMIHEWLIQLWHDPIIAQWVKEHPFSREQPQIAPRDEAVKRRSKRKNEDVAQQVENLERMKSKPYELSEGVKNMFKMPEDEPGRNGKAHK